MNDFIRAHRARRKFSTQEVLDLLGQGLSQTAVAERLGVTDGAIYHRLRAEGIVAYWPAKAARIDDEFFERLWNCRAISIQEIADSLGVTRQAVSDRAARRGLPSRADNRRRKVRDDEFRELWLAGVHTRDIAAHFGLASRTCCSVAVKRLGLPRRQRGSGGPGGWPPAISLREYMEMQLGQRMAQAAGGDSE